MLSVTLEELEFVVEGPRADAIRATDTELTIRKCSFRREGAASFGRAKLPVNDSEPASGPKPARPWRH